MVGDVVKAVLLRARCSFELSTFHVAEKASLNIEGNAFFYDILILDSEEKESLKLVQMVRKVNNQASILFIVRQVSDLPALLRYRPSGSIFDAGDTKHIVENFRTAYREQMSLTSYFTVKTRESLIKIRFGDILFFESSQRVVKLYTAKEKKQYSFYAKLDDVYEKLPKNQFVKCHQSFAVNLMAVERLDRISRQFILVSGHAVDISKRSYTEVSERFEVFAHIA